MIAAVDRAVRVVVLGAGYRGRAYAAYSEAHPGELEVVGVADPEQAGTIPSPRSWRDWRECLAARPDADMAVVALPDALHYEAAMSAMAAGYHLLLEKPLATTEEQCREIVATAVARGLLVITGHVLRYTRYFAHIKAILDSGELGEVVSIAQQESVGFFKIAHSHCRGNWSNSVKASPIILQKCSHDFDLFSWWLGRRCLRVSSFGSIKVFRRGNRPAGAADRCMDCPAEVERGCVWSAKKMYLDYGDRLGYMFADTSRAAMERVVRETEYGRCVYACDNNVPDHQVVNMEFEGGATVSFVMAGFTERNVRTTRISCTRGEIVGDGETLHICSFDGASVDAGGPFSRRLDNPSRHGGGDFNLMAEAIRLVRKGTAEEIKSTTEEALESHLIAFAAEKSRLEGGRVIELK